MIVVSAIAIKRYGETGRECNHIGKGKRRKMQSLSRKNGRKMLSSALGKMAGNAIRGHGNMINDITLLSKMA
jgi:hypothetical protein